MLYLLDDPISPPIKRLLDQCRKAFVFVFLITFVTELLSVSPILYMLNMYDHVLPSHSGTTLIAFTVLILMTYAFWMALEWIRTRMMIRVSMRIDWELATKVFDASFRKQLARQQVNVHQVMGDLVQVRQFLTGQSILALMEAPFATIFIIIGALFHPYLAVFAIIASIIMLVATYYTDKTLTPLLKQANQGQTESNQMAAQSLRYSETAFGLGMLGNIRERWYERHQSYISKQLIASEAAGLMKGITGFLTKSFPSLQMGLAIYLAIEGLITGGMVIAASFLITKSISPIQKLLGSWKEIVSVRQAYRRLDEMLLEDPSWGEHMALPPPKGRIEVQQVTARPPGAKQAVLKDINFTLNPGEVLAVIGPSAAGKSTLSRLLVGIWEPEAGHLRLDGADIHPWAKDGLGSLIGYVPQEVEFFEASVGANIARLGVVDPIKAVTAAKLIDVHDTILAFPAGYETKLSESGFALTGGQKQKIAIARALYGLPNYIVMDEPNASLDEKSEAKLIQVILGLKSVGKTVIFSTHRTALLAAADKLLVLDAGRQIAFGPARELLQMASDAEKNKVQPLKQHA